MKKIVSFTLCFCVCFSFFGLVCASADEALIATAEQPATDIAAVNETALKPVDDNGTLTLPAVTEYNGYAFRGFFTEPEGQGTRVTASSVTSDTVMYAYYTAVEEDPEYKVMAFVAFPYDHDTYVDVDGVTRNVGYRGTEEDFRELREFGINIMTIDYYRNQCTLTADCDYNIRMCEQYDIDFFICDGSVMDENLTKEELDVLTAPYVNSKNFRGFYIGDEPGFGALGGLCRIIRNLQAAYPFADCHTNLCSYELISGWTNLSDYYKYYYEHSGTFHISADPYPYGNSTDENHSYVQYFKELQTLAKAAKTSGRELWAYAQIRNDFEDDYTKLFYSIYSQFMFGVTGQVLFCYGNTNIYPARSERGSDSTLYNGLNNRTEEWYITRDILADIRSFEDVFTKYAWDNAGYTIKREGSQMPLYTGTVLQDLQFDAVEDRIVISEFTERNGSGAAVALLNDTTYTWQKTVHFSFTAPGAVKATVYAEGETYELTPDENGVYSVDIPTWRGMYITFDYYEA